MLYNYGVSLNLSQFGQFGADISRQFLPWLRSVYVRKEHRGRLCLPFLVETNIVYPVIILNLFV